MNVKKPKLRGNRDGSIGSESMPVTRDADIAVIGIACRFPGAVDSQIFWDNLANGVDSIRESKRWDLDKNWSPNDNRYLSKWLGLLDDADQFDADFFNISPREAIQMDPQQRILLEETWHCIEDSGVPLKTLQQKKTSVYVGVLGVDPYLQAATETDIDVYSGSGMYPFMLANRISYFLNLNGESISIDAACASAFVALYNAKNSFAVGDSDYAFVAGVNLHFTPLKYLMWSKNRMLSPTGKCKTFDSDADGFVAGEGAGVLLLQPFDQAVKDQNHIYGIIKGCAINHGGKAISVSTPRMDAQKEVILEAYAAAGFGPETVSYVETHGTGTSLGDPIEIEALTQAFQRHTTQKHFCKIGSVKTNVGHLMAAAGMPSIIKVLLMMRHKMIPPSLNISMVNPIIDLEHSPFVIADHLTDWRHSDQEAPLRAGISSFGYGGVNTHVLIEEYVVKQTKSQSEMIMAFPFLLSAKTAASLNALLNQWRDFTGTTDFRQLSLKDICLTLLTGREPFGYRYGGLVKSKTELIKYLEQEIDDLSKPKVNDSWCLRLGDHVWDSNNGWDLMMRQFPIFHEKLDEVLECFAELEPEHRLKEGLFRKNWPQPLIPLYSFILTYTYIAVLFELGFSVSLITGSKQGFWNSIVASQMVSLRDVLAVLTGKKELNQIKFTRPAISFYEPIKQQTITPYVFDAGYIEDLLRNLDISNEIFLYYLNKTRLLITKQFTFKKFLEEWDDALSVAGYNLKKMLNDKDYFAPEGKLDQRQKLLFSIIMVSSYYRLNQKWNLSEPTRITDERFYELLDLILDKVMTKENLITLLTDDNRDLAVIAESLNLEQHRINKKKPYPFLNQHSRDIFEIPDLQDWRRKMLALEEPSYANQIACIDFGKFGNETSIAAITIDPFTKMPDAFPNILLQLWRKGFDISWQILYRDTSFQKIPLPVYVFERDSFWLSDSQNPDGHHRISLYPLKDSANESQPVGHSQSDQLNLSISALSDSSKNGPLSKGIKAKIQPKLNPALSVNRVLQQVYHGTLAVEDALTLLQDFYD